LSDDGSPSEGLETALTDGILKPGKFNNIDELVSCQRCHRPDFPRLFFAPFLLAAGWGDAIAARMLIDAGPVASSCATAAFGPGLALTAEGLRPGRPLTIRRAPPLQ